MTTEQMKMLTGCESWEQLIKLIIERDHHTEAFVTVERTARISRKSDDGPGDLVFQLGAINISLEEIKAKAYDEISSKVRNPSPYPKV